MLTHNPSGPVLSGNLFFRRLRERVRRASLRYQMLRQRKHWAARDPDAEFLEVEIQANVRMRLYYDDQLSQLIYCEAFEWYEREFVTRFLRPGDVFVDVGANIGLFSVIASHCVGVSGRVFSIEPSPKPFQRLLENIRLNGSSNTFCARLALSDRIGSAVMAMSCDGYDAWNSLAHPIDGSSFSEESVNCITWDSFAREQELQGKVALMKIDIEGWESKMLQGARESFLRPDAPVLQVEFTDAASIAAGSSCQDLYRLLQEFGYEMFIYDGSSKTIVPAPLRSAYPYVNLIATKNTADIAVRLAL